MTVEEKALELLAENRVVIASPDHAIVAGYTGHYDVMFTKEGGACSCPARVRPCAHILAAMGAFTERAEELKPPW